MTTPLAAWFRRFSLFFLIAFCAILIIYSRFDPDAFSRFRSTVQSFSEPLLSGFSQPVLAARDLGTEFQSYGDLRIEVERLRLENGRLKLIEAEYLDLKAENDRLRDQARLVDEEQLSFITARIISDQGSVFSRSMLLNAGAEHGVRKGFAVMAETGLIGRVLDVGRRTSLVLLITDVNSRIPVIVERTGAPGVLIGSNEPFLQLSYATADAQAAIRSGDRIVTSGSGGVFPFGLPAGSVVRADASTVLAKPLVDWERRHYVKIVDYNLNFFLPGSEDRSQ